MRYTKAMNIPDFTKELLFCREFFPVGVDEVGRGPLAGPVVAAAVLYKDNNFIVPEELQKQFLWIRDSKKLAPKKRAEIDALIREYFWVGVGIVAPETIDRINILEATFLAMKSAVSDLKRVIPREAQNKLYLLIDGNQLLPNTSLPQEAVVQGDSKVRSIAAASVIAKVIRDAMMDEYEKEYPGYGFSAHKGYGTKIHMEALQRLGVTPIHRKSFKPVQLASPEAVNKKFEKILKSR